MPDFPCDRASSSGPQLCEKRQDRGPGPHMRRGGGRLLPQATEPDSPAGSHPSGTGNHLRGQLIGTTKWHQRASRGPDSYHRNLDFTFRKDESRIREKNLRANFAWLNRFRLSLLKQYPGKDSIVMRRRGCGGGENILLQVLTGATL